MQSYNTLPAKLAQLKTIVPKNVRRESVEIIGESSMESPVNQRSNFRRSHSKNKKLTPSKAMKWIPEQKSKSRYFHAECFRSFIRRPSKDLELSTLKWVKLHIVIFDKVLVFFSADKYEFESRVQLAAVKSIKRVRIAGKSSTYFGMGKSFVIRFQTRADRINFRNIMGVSIDLNKSMNISKISVLQKESTPITPKTQHRTIIRSRPRARSTPDEHELSGSRFSKITTNFRSFRFSKKTSPANIRPTFLDNLKRKTKEFKKKLSR